MNKSNFKITELIKENFKAYCANFETPVLIKADSGPGIYIYKNETDPSYIQYCYNADYLNGWLYGAVQAKCKCINTIPKKEV